MKILFLNTDIDYAGATKIMLWLAGRFSKFGHEVIFLTYRNATETKLIPKGIQHIHLQLESSGHSIQGLLKSVRLLHGFIKKGSFDLGIAFLSPSQLRMSLASIGTSMKLLFSQRGDPYHFKPSFSFFSRLSSYAFSRADKFVFQTEAARAYYGQKIRERSVVIPNPVDNINMAFERSPDNRIVNVARLDVRQKRQDLLIQAFFMICNDYPELSLHLFGSGESEKELRSLANNCNRIVFEGVSDDVTRDIHNARLFVLSSDFEGIPNALIEAMSLGIPCVSTKCSPGGAELLIENGVNGLLTPCGDAIALANAIKAMLDDQAFAEKCGREARSIVDTFSEDKIFNQWEAFIES